MKFIDQSTKWTLIKLSRFYYEIQCLQSDLDIQTFSSLPLFFISKFTIFQINVYKFSMTDKEFN